MTKDFPMSPSSSATTKTVGVSARAPTVCRVWLQVDHLLGCDESPGEGERPNRRVAHTVGAPGNKRNEH